MAKKLTEKMCIRCRQIKPVTEFYGNKGWASQNYCDTICKECARQVVTDKESARKYCWENNRMWTDKIWEVATKKAMSVLANNAEWLKKSTSQKRKDEIEAKLISSQFFFAMNV